MYGYGDLLYPTVLVVPSSAEQNGNRVPDPWESVMANTFSPVLHKHSWDKQPGIADFESTVYYHSTLRGTNEAGQLVYNNRIPPIHVWQQTFPPGWDSFGNGQHPTSWKIDIDDDMSYAGVPGGYGPLYFHMYKPNSEDRIYYLQYWYFFGMNDVSDKTSNHVWHEGDWEHVSIKLQRATGSSFTPVAVNFYLHDGGKTRTPGQTWWSATNSPTYAGIQQGYDANHTHLHVWLAANSHASYNRYEQVYRVDIDFVGLPLDTYIDNVDCAPSSFDLYFPYDVLLNLGEVTRCTYCSAHGYTWFEHITANAATPAWLPYTGLIGDFWENGLAATESTLSPAAHVSWRIFQVDYSQAGFGNANDSKKTITWVDDQPSGD